MLIGSQVNYEINTEIRLYFIYQIIVYYTIKSIQHEAYIHTKKSQKYNFPVVHEAGLMAKVASIAQASEMAAPFKP